MGCDAHVLVTGGPAEPARDRVEVDLAASAVTRFLPPPRRAGGIHPARVS